MHFHIKIPIRLEIVAPMGKGMEYNEKNQEKESLKKGVRGKKGFPSSRG